jgi:hypothetical protein
VAPLCATTIAFGIALSILPSYTARMAHRMRLSVPKIDGRSVNSPPQGVIDLDTGNIVGYVRTSGGATVGARGEPCRHISLFDGKFTGNFGRHHECVAFAKGVEAVLSHLTGAPSEG